LNLSEKCLPLHFIICDLGRYLAVDYGTKRCGIAVTDPTGMIASPLSTVPTHTLIDFLASYFKQEQVDLVVLGYPRKMNNQDSESLIYIREFEKKFRKTFPDMRLEWMDERFTSGMAMQAMISGGMKKSERQKKENLDRISAAIILQSFLEKEENEKRRI